MGDHVSARSKAALCAFTCGRRRRASATPLLGEVRLSLPSPCTGFFQGATRALAVVARSGRHVGHS